MRWARHQETGRAIPQERVMRWLDALAAGRREAWSRVIWLPEALADIERLHQFLAEKSPGAARNAVLRIRAAAAQLEDFRWRQPPGNLRRLRRLGRAADQWVLF